MAIVVKYPTSRYWVAAFRDSSGRQHRRTTRETNRKRAQAIADKYERISKGKGDAQRVRQVMNEFFRDHYGEEIPLSSIRQYVLEWLATRKVETSPATNVIYDRSAQRFLSFLGANADKSLESVSRTLIADFRDSCTRQTTAGAANTDLKIVKAIFRSARREGYLLRDPAEGIKPIKSRDEATERRPLTISEIRSILAVADPEWQSLIRFGLFTGQRLGDLALLTWGQIG
jgi:integrase